MIDKIKILKKREELPEDYHYFLWNKVTTIKDKELGYYPSRAIRGWLGKIRVELTSVNLSVTFNPTKYVLSDNLGSINLNQFIYSLKDIGDQLNVDLFTGRVTKLDIAGNVIVKYPVEEYTDILFSANYLTRIKLNKTLYFKNTKSRTIVFYDKLKEMSSNGIKVNECFKGVNIIRYEYRFLNQESLSSFLKVRIAKVEDVIKFYFKLINEWRNFFIKIKKTPDKLMFNKNAWVTKGEIDRQIKILGINAMGGLEAINTSIDYAKGRGYFKKHPSRSSQLKQKYRNWMNHPLMFKQTDKAKELEMKIDRFAQNQI